MALYTGIGGVRRELSSVRTGVGGVNREVTDIYAGSNGVNRSIYSGEVEVSQISAEGDLWNVYVLDGGGRPDSIHSDLSVSYSSADPTILQINYPYLSYPYLTSYKLTMSFSKSVSHIGVHFLDGTGVPSLDPQAGNILSAPGLSLNGEEMYSYPPASSFYLFGGDTLTLEVSGGSSGAGAEYLGTLTYPIKLRVRLDGKDIDFSK